MNFENLRTAWKRQQPAEPGAPPASLDAQLLERIRRNQRGYVRAIALMVLSQAIAAGLFVGALLLYLKLDPHTSQRVIHEWNIGFGAAVVLVVGFSIVAGRHALRLYSTRADPSALSVGDRVHAGARWYRLDMIIADAGQILSGLLLMTLLLVVDSHFGLQGPLRWICPVVVAVPVLAVLVYRVYSHSLRPRLGRSLSEVLAFSMQQTRSRAWWAEQAWWQAGLSTAAFFFGMKPFWLYHGAVRPATWAMLVSCLAVPALVRAVTKTSRRSVESRIKELEALRAGLTDCNQPAGPAPLGPPNP